MQLVQSVVLIWLTAAAPIDNSSAADFVRRIFTLTIVITLPTRVRDRCFMLCDGPSFHTTEHICAYVLRAIELSKSSDYFV